MVSLAGLTRSHSGGTWRGGGGARPEGSDGLLLPSTEGARGKAGKGSVAPGSLSPLPTRSPVCRSSAPLCGPEVRLQGGKSDKAPALVDFSDGPSPSGAGPPHGCREGGARGGASGSASPPLGERLPPRAALRRGCRVGGVRPLRGCLRLVFIVHWRRSEGRRDFRAFFDRPLEGEEEGGGLRSRPPLRL